MARIVNLKNGGMVDVTTLTNDLVEESTAIRLADESNDKVIILLLASLKLFLLFHFGHFEDAED